MGQGPVESVERKPDTDDPGYDMLDAVADDMLEAFKRGDKKLLKEALSALCDHIATLDEAQDQETAP